MVEYSGAKKRRIPGRTVSGPGRSTYSRRFLPSRPAGRSAGSSAECTDTQKESEVVPASIVEDLVDVALHSEDRSDEGEEDGPSVPQTAPEASQVVACSSGSFGGGVGSAACRQGKNETNNNDGQKNGSRAHDNLRYEEQFKGAKNIALRLKLVV
jgi:hypothetical protein